MALVINKKAGFNYEIIEKYEAGLVLEGYEVKALRAGRAQLLGAYVTLRAGEAFLKGLHVTPIQQNNLPLSFKEERSIKILLNKNEIKELYKELDSKGVTLIPISIYDSKGTLKCEIALVRGKKLHDKRATLKARDDKREIARTLEKL